MRRALPFVALLGIVAAVGAGIALAGGNALPKELQDVKAAVARYHSVTQAEAAGYVPAGPCEQSPDGAMGIHYINPPLLGDPALDPLKPEILLYLPDDKGKLRLVGVEYFTVDADQDLATAEDRPVLFGRGFDGPMPGHNPEMPIHYDLHAWVVESNPGGVFAIWNPAIACP